MHTAAGVGGVLILLKESDRLWPFNKRLIAPYFSFLIVFFAAIPAITFSTSLEQSSQPAPVTLQNRSDVYLVSKLPVSTLNLTLTGTITGTSKSALISVAGREEESIAVGQFITDHVLLVDVDQKNAVIYRDGLYEKLELRGGAGSDMAVLAVTDVTLPLLSETDISASKVLIDPGQNATKQASVSTKKLSYMGMRFDSSDLLSQAKITYNPEGGLEITETTSGGIYERLGLESGDTIKTINEEPVNSFFDLVSLSQHAGSSSKVAAKIMRSGNLYRMQFDPTHGIEIDMVVAPEEERSGY